MFFLHSSFGDILRGTRWALFPFSCPRLGSCQCSLATLPGNIKAIKSIPFHSADVKPLFSSLTKPFKNLFFLFFFRKFDKTVILFFQLHFKLLLRLTFFISSFYCGFDVLGVRPQVLLQLLAEISQTIHSVVFSENKTQVQLGGGEMKDQDVRL